MVIAEPYIVSCSFSFNEIIVKGTREGECSPGGGGGGGGGGDREGIPHTHPIP